MSLRRPIAVVAASPAVASAHRLTVDVSAILEPVWSVLATCGGTTAASGFCAVSVLPRPKPTRSMTPLPIGPSRSIRSSTWLRRPCGMCVRLPGEAAALLTSVRLGLRRQPAASESEPTACTLGATVRLVLLDTWTDDTSWSQRCGGCCVAGATWPRTQLASYARPPGPLLAAALLAPGTDLDGDTATVKWFISRPAESGADRRGHSVAVGEISRCTRGPSPAAYNTFR
jgi:hypothetical protein